MQKLRIDMFVLIALALTAASLGCGDDDDSTPSKQKDAGDDGSGGKGSGGGGNSGKGAGTGGKSGSDDAGPTAHSDGGGDNSGNGAGGADGGGGSSGNSKCPALKDREQTVIDSEVDADATWSCDKLYILTDLIFVTKNSTLTVEAGTIVQGDSGSALISTRGSKLVTTGTSDAPVVFTSSADNGARAGGDWGGVVMLGDAPINIGDENRVEGIEATDDRGLYGGKDKKSNCGSLLYTRIEYGGFELSVDNELNGLTLGACGSDTSISYVQVHRGSDDGIEIFGGSPKLDHILLTANADDGLDSDLGNTGLVQFLVIQQDPTEADSGFEWNNQTGGDDDASPRSAPTVYNATLIGGNDSTGTQNGLTLRGGTAGIVRNIIVTGFPIGAIDVRDVSTVDGANKNPPILTVENSLFFKNGPDGKTHFQVEPTDGSMDDDDMGFVEEDFFRDDARMNVFDKDPKIGDAFSLTKPDYVPASGSPATVGAATPPDDGFFDKTATYKGAFEPGGRDWTAGWTTHDAS
jgi:hypothetical protein